jgi:hypothetical protein
MTLPDTCKVNLHGHQLVKNIAPDHKVKQRRFAVQPRYDLKTQRRCRSSFQRLCYALGFPADVSGGRWPTGRQARKRAYMSGHSDAIVRACRAFVLVLP